jgi:hypothetical protein
VNPRPAGRAVCDPSTPSQAEADSLAEVVRVGSPKTKDPRRRPDGKEERRRCIRSDAASRSRRRKPGCRADRRPAIRPVRPQLARASESEASRERRNACFRPRRIHSARPGQSERKRSESRALKSRALKHETPRIRAGFRSSFSEPPLVMERAEIFVCRRNSINPGARRAVGSESASARGATHHRRANPCRAARRPSGARCPGLRAPASSGGGSAAASPR